MAITQIKEKAEAIEVIREVYKKCRPDYLIDGNGVSLGIYHALLTVIEPDTFFSTEVRETLEHEAEQYINKCGLWMRQGE